MQPPKVPHTPISLEGNTEGSGPTSSEPLLPPEGDRRVDPPALSGRVPGLPSTPQDEAGLTRHLETSPVGGPTCRKTPISLPALEKNPRPGHLFEGKPVGEGTTRRGTVTVVHHPETPAGSTHSSTRGLRPPEHRDGHGSLASFRPRGPKESDTTEQLN